MRTWALYAVMALLLVSVTAFQSASLALTILNMCLISAVMALGINIQWGYAGLFNVGIMGFAALGGLAAVLISVAPVPEAWSVGGAGLGATLLLLGATVALVLVLRRALPPGRPRTLGVALVVIAGVWLARGQFLPAVAAIESVNPSRAGFLGGLGLPIVLSWAAGGLLAAAAAWLIARIALGLRADYLAIATLGISEIVIAILKNEDWLSRGVKNVSGLPRPVPYERALQENESFIGFVARWHDVALTDSALRSAVIDAAGVTVKLCYSLLFAAVLVGLLWLARRAQRAPWGRLMRAIRDNPTAAAAMGKDVVFRQRQVFVIGSAVIGIAGAMLVTLEGQLTPGAYNPLRFTFLIWVMVIVGGSGNNAGAVLGAFLIWFVWVQAEPLGRAAVEFATAGLDPSNALRLHLLEQAQHMRLFMMGLILLLVLRFAPGGLLPERVRR